MKAHQFLTAVMFTTGIILTPAVYAGEGVTVGVPDDEAPVVEKVKGGDDKPSAEKPIVFPNDVTEHLEDMWPKIYEVLRDRSRNPEQTLKDIIRQHSWTPEQIYEITRTAIIQNPSIADKIETILKEAGVSDEIIRIIVDKLREDDNITDGGVHIGEEFPIIPTPDPVTSGH